RRPGPGGVYDRLRPGFDAVAIRRAKPDADHSAAVTQKALDAAVVQRTGAGPDGVENVGPGEAVRIHAPLLHGHSPSHPRAEAGFEQAGFGTAQTDVRMGVLKRLEAVVDLHRGLQPLDPQVVARQHREQEHAAVDEMASDTDDVAGILAGLP